MCEQTEVEYLPDEIVWVKLHQPSVWWPGQVQDYDKLPEDVTEGLKKKPIAIVKFFQEDTYEYVNNLNNIYRYNCSKKHDFIKKGLALARSKRPERPSHMTLFPQDVATAESLTHGNPDIIRDEEFAPEEKPSYEGLFGSEKKKKAKSVVESILKERPSWRVKPLIATGKPAGTPKRPSSPKLVSPKVITHRRFINKALRGESDYKICIREQPIVEDETASPSPDYRCHSCDFVTTRLNVIVLHYRSHSKSTTPVPNKVKVPKVKSAKPTVPKPKAETPSKSTPVEPPKKRNILREATEEPVEKTSSKKSPKAQTPKAQAPKAQAPKAQAPKAQAPKTPEKTPKSQPPKRKAKVETKPEVEEKKAKKEEIQELLKDWSDEEVEEESQGARRASEDEDSKMEVDEKEEPKKAEEERTKSAPPVKSKAVFDFDDDDEGLDPKLTQNSRVFGRKLPRVIDNIKERRTSFPDSPEAEDTIKEEEKKTEDRKAAAEDAEVGGEAQNDDEEAEKMKELESMNAEIDSLLEKTSIPDLPEIPKLNAFSMDVTDDLVPTEKNKEEAKDKSVLREHNNISANAPKDEDAAPAEEQSKNSMPEVGSAVEETSTPPQANPVKITAEKPKPRTSAVITSVILTSPQSTSGGDHSYVSEKRPPVAQMPPLVPTSPKSPPGKSRTFILSRSSPVKSPTSGASEDAGLLKLVGVPQTASKTTKPLPSLVKKDGKYVIVRTTQSGDVKVMPSLAPTSAGSAKVMAQPMGQPPGKKLVILSKQASGDVVLTSQRQANILSKTPQRSSTLAKVTSSSAASPASTLQTRKASETKTVLPPKKNIILTSPSGNAKTILVPVSNAKSSPVYTTRSPGGSKSVVLPQTVKLVSSKDKPGKVVLQMDSQKTRVQLPTMRRAVPQIRAPRSSDSLKLAPVLSSPKSQTSSPKTLSAASSPKTLTAASSTKTLEAVTSPRTVATVSSPKPLAAVSPPKTKQNLSFSQTLAALATQKPTTSRRSAGASSKSSASPKTPPKPNKFFHRETSSATPTLVKQPAAPIKKSGAATKVTVSPAQTKPGILQTTPRTTAKVTPKPSKAPEQVVTSAPAAESLPEGLPPGSVVTAADGADGGAIMYILDNGTLISYDQNQSDSQSRTVFIDPASLTSSSGDLSNLIFTFDDSAAHQGTLLNIAPQEGEQAEFAFAPGTGTVNTVPARATGSTQDILAEALANTQVLQAEATASEMMLDSSSIATNTVPSSSALYPNNVLTLSNDVLETSLTLNAPIMTPLEVPSAVSSLQPPPAASGSLDLPMTIAQPDITISTPSFASLPIPSATIQGSVFTDSTTATYSTMVPVLSGADAKRTFFVEGTEGATFEFACATSDS